MKLITLGLATATAFVFASSILLAAAAELEGARALAIELGAPFHDHAVLQRGMTVPVWGWSEPGTKATGAWKNGNCGDCSAIAFAFAHKLHKELNVPVGILNCSFSQTSIQSWVPREGFATAGDDYSKAIHLRCLQTDPTTPEHKEAWDAFYNNLHCLVRGWRIVWDKPELPVYFHQFYSAGMRNSGKEVNQPSIDPTAEMRLGTWLARAIPHTGMASQIDVSGGIHDIHKAVPGQRLALHALKNQYGKDVVTDGPMFKSYKVEGEKVIVTSPGVQSPRGVSYATGEVGFQPNLYNQALLPMTPFIYFDHKMVTSKTWPNAKMKIAGETIDPATVGKTYDYRKMPLLGVQFRDDAVFQAGKPVTTWGSTRMHGEWQSEPEKGDCKVHFEFGPEAGPAAIKEVIGVSPEMAEWKVTLPPMEDYKSVGGQYFDNPHYLVNVRRYIAEWKTYWDESIPAMMKTRAVPDGSSWGSYPSPDPKLGDSQATWTYNVHVHCFTPAALSGVVFLSAEAMVADDQGAHFGPEMAALAKCLKTRFTLGQNDADIPLIYTVPGKSLAPRITRPEGLNGQSTAVGLNDWQDLGGVFEAVAK